MHSCSPAWDLLNQKSWGWRPRTKPPGSSDTGGSVRTRIPRCLTIWTKTAPSLSQAWTASPAPLNTRYSFPSAASWSNCICSSSLIQTHAATEIHIMLYIGLGIVSTHMYMLPSWKLFTFTSEPREDREWFSPKGSSFVTSMACFRLSSNYIFGPDLHSWLICAYYLWEFMTHINIRKFLKLNN